MFAHGIQHTPQIHQSVSVQSQSFDGCPANRSKTDNPSRIGIPRKMLKPFLQPWVKERNRITSCRVNRACLNCFMVIASLTREREILCKRFAATLARQNMFYRKRLRRKFFLTTTVFTASFCAGFNQSSEFYRNIDFHSASSVNLWSRGVRYRLYVIREVDAELHHGFA